MEAGMREEGRLDPKVSPFEPFPVLEHVKLESPLPSASQISPFLFRNTSSMPSHHRIVGFPGKYLGTFLNTAHPHFWGLWQCVLIQALGRDGELSQGLSCLAAPPALMPRAG